MRVDGQVCRALIGAEPSRSSGESLVVLALLEATAYIIKLGFNRKETV